MKSNLVKYVIYSILPIVSITGGETFIVTAKSITLTPIYRTKLSKIKLQETSETINTVSELVARRFEKNKEDIDPELNFFKEFGADRLDEVELLILLEDEFDLSIPDNQFKTLRTVKEISKYIDSKIQGKKISPVLG
ncbi:uncharacterized protein TOT_020001081 [Theileria orientalis strain Shintoku]|uniref:Acyl carrier protein n=1 Tax=Theileria orientalis strain Shintoku TaxID=869250 RepID=J4D7W9_THEOR|nr:uncharacterized protein TOT_020001081 [Theileria orientalis strain Shintoku]BAM40420.1 uncharacterized protein TOT_020001081 [Theileria orientalis strain Shintoku]|eukprot:XP_009690721.1 uncharacterized protein TOT_020001081 [Theileria orientalis strain Shintoku]